MKKYSLLPILFISFWAFSQTPAENLYAGIEIGSKGVKMTIVNMYVDDKGDCQFKIIDEPTANTDVIEFSPNAFDQTAKEVKNFYVIAQEKFKIPITRILFVISSGVKNEATKRATEKVENKTAEQIQQQENFILDQIKFSIRKEINEPSKTIDIISSQEEARFSHLILVDKKDRYESSLVDIGSGNTKGGCFIGKTEYSAFSFSWGTKSIRKELDKKNYQSITEYTDGSSLFTNKVVKDELYNSSIGNRPIFFFSGGASWTLATLIHPESISENCIKKNGCEITLLEVQNFRKKLIDKNYEIIFDPENMVKQIKEDCDRQNALEEIKRVFKVFDQKDIIAGSALFESMLKEFNTNNNRKGFYIIRNGYFGWITGYLLNKACW